MNEIGALPYSVNGYCATCDKSFGHARNDTLGYRINCGKDHLAQVISADEPAKWWLRKEAWLLDWQTGRDRCLFCSPFALLKRCQKWLWKRIRGREPSKLIQAGHYLTACFLLIGVGLLLEIMDSPTWLRLLLGVLICWRFVDIFLSSTSINFTSRFPANPLRSVVFSILTFVQIALSYGYFYCLLVHGNQIGPKQNETFSVIEAVYFSFGTIATVGYGALEPKEWIGKIVVASELVLGLSFVVIIIAQVAGWTSQSKVELGLFSWDDLKHN